MTEEKLTREELAPAVTTSEPKPEDTTALETARRQPKVYDFTRPDKFTLDQIRTISIMHETAARLMTTSLSAALRILAHVHVAFVDQLTFEEFIRSVSNPSSLSIVSLEPLNGTAVFQIDPAVTFSIVDRLLGGKGSTEGANLGRDLTDIEHTLVEGLVKRLLPNLAEGWKEVIPLRPRLTSIETNPQFAQIVPPSEMVVLVNFETRIGDVVGAMNLALPFITIEPIIGKLSAEYWYTSLRKRDGAPSATPAGLDIPAEVCVEGEKLSMRQLGRLAKGSLVRVSAHARGEAFLRMGGRVILRLENRPGAKGKPFSYAVTESTSTDKASYTRPAAGKVAPSPWEEGVRRTLEELGSRIGDSLMLMKNEVAELRQQQEAITDQLTFGTSNGAAVEPAKSPETRVPFESVRRADPAHLLNFIRQEHPQTVALVLAYLEPQTAGVILGGLPPETQPDVARRIATMSRIAPEVLRAVEGVLEKKLSTLSAEEQTSVGGVQSVVEILNISSRSLEKNVVESLEKLSADLAEEIKRRMFVFEDISLLGEETAGLILRRIDPEDLLRAMKTAPENVKSFIWDCLPPADAQKLKVRFEELGRVRLSEVDAAQQRIIAKIREMDEVGEIVVARPGETVG